MTLLPGTLAVTLLNRRVPELLPTYRTSAPPEHVAHGRGVALPVTVFGGIDSASYDDAHAVGRTCDPRPITSSISCSTERRASKLPLMRGRVNQNSCAELSVTIPSYGPPGPTVPSWNMAGGVSNPTARPFALDGAMFVDNALPGRLAFARLSLLVRASALKWLMKLFHDTV